MALTATVRPLDPPEEDAVAALLAAAAVGDGVAWSRLVERYRNLLRHVTRAQGLTAEQSADVAQITWLRLLEHIGDVRDPDRLAGWLSTTARRESIATRRRTWHESLTAECPAAAGTAPDLEERIVAAQQAQELRRAVERLPARERRLVAGALGRAHHGPVAGLRPCP